MPHLFDIGHRKQAVMDPRRVAATWKDVEWLRAFTKLPLVLKGILDPEDAARRCSPGPRRDRVAITAAGTSTPRPRPSTRCRRSSSGCGRVPVLVDGGVRRGTDVLKAIALGARAVLIGRPYCYGLSVAGSDGVRRVVDILRAELETAMMLSGAARLAEIDRSVLY